jgi:hypothetical protein
MLDLLIPNTRAASPRLTPWRITSCTTRSLTSSGYALPAPRARPLSPAPLLCPLFLLTVSSLSRLRVSPKRGTVLSELGRD